MSFSQDACYKWKVYVFCSEKQTSCSGGKGPAKDQQGK